MLAVANILDGIRFPDDVKKHLKHDYEKISELDSDESSLLDDLYRAGIANCDNEIMPIKPDIIGEYFVYKHLIRCTKQAEYQQRQDYLKNLTTTLYVQSTQMIFFVIKATLDHPQLIKDSLLEDILIQGSFIWDNANSHQAYLHFLVLTIFCKTGNIEHVVRQFLTMNETIRNDTRIQTVVVKILSGIVNREQKAMQDLLSVLHCIDSLSALVNCNIDLANEVCDVIFDVAICDQISDDFLNNEIMPRLHQLHQRFFDSAIISKAYGNCLGMKAYFLYAGGDHIGAALTFIESIELDGQNSKTNLAYMLRRNEIDPCRISEKYRSIDTLLFSNSESTD